MATESESRWSRPRSSGSGSGSESELAEVDLSDEPPEAICLYCGRPFRRQRYHDLHLGVAHEERLTEREREVYEDARHVEADELFVFHLKVIAALSVMWAVFVLGFMVFAV